jgi:hypothetical protein
MKSSDRLRFTLEKVYTTAGVDHRRSKEINDTYLGNLLFLRGKSEERVAGDKVDSMLDQNSKVLPHLGPSRRNNQIH